MVYDIDHIAIVVKKIEETMPVYTRILGFRVKNIEDLPQMHVRVAMLESSNGTTHIELIEPLVPDTGVSRFLDKKGESVHHLCFTVEDLQGELDRLKAQGIRLIDEIPRKGEGGSMVAFLHPESCRGMLIELKQRAQYQKSNIKNQINIK